MTETRDNGREILRFTIERTLTFRRDGDGWVATVTSGRSETMPRGAQAAMFQRAMARLEGTTIVYRLDAQGAITGIDEESVQWARFIAAVIAIGGDADQARDAAAIATALGSLGAEQRRQVLATPIETAIAAREADRRASPGASVTIPARTLLGEMRMIAGTETVSEIPSAILIVTEAAGPLDVDQGSRVRIIRTREIDRATGLIRTACEETVTDIAVDGQTARQSIVITTQLLPVVL